MDLKEVAYRLDGLESDLGRVQAYTCNEIDAMRSYSASISGLPEIARALRNITEVLLSAFDPSVVPEKLLEAKSILDRY